MLKFSNFDMIKSEPKLITKNITVAKQWLTQQLDNNETASVHKHIYVDDKYVYNYCR